MHDVLSTRTLLEKNLFSELNYGVNSFYIIIGSSIYKLFKEEFYTLVIHSELETPRKL